MKAEEIADLRRRLLEAEETIRAIRTGEVDALVVSGKGDVDDIFDIGSDTESYRSFMEVMDIGAMAVDEKGRMLYVNAHLAAALGADPFKLQGSLIEQFLPVESARLLSTLLVENGPANLQIDVRGGKYIAAAKPLKLGTVEGYAVTLSDITERVRTETAVASERAARAVIASANEAVLVCDRDGVITHANAAASSVYAGSPIGLVFSNAIPLIFPGATGLVQADDIVSMAISGTSVQGIEAIAPEAPSVKDYLISAAPLQVGNDDISGCVITMVDLSQRKAAEKQQLLLMRELDHRVKNTLALVLSISGRTMRNVDTLDDFQKSFTGRIQALSATHNLLAENSWNHLTLGEVVEHELAPYLGGLSDRVELKGLDVGVEPRAAIAFGLIVHELATNAAKYGALSVSDGHVSVESKGLSDDGLGSLIVEWQESGGPLVAPPTREGFGKSVITRSLQYSPGGGATLDYQPSGICCMIRIPAEDLS